MAEEEPRSFKPAVSEVKDRRMDIGSNLSKLPDRRETLINRHFMPLPTAIGDSRGTRLTTNVEPSAAAAAEIINPLMQLARAQFHRQMKLFYDEYHQNEKIIAESQAEELQRQVWIEQGMLKEKQLEEQKRMEQERLELIKSKPKDLESAIASDEVKQHLRSAIISRARRGNGQRVMWARSGSHDGGAQESPPLPTAAIPAGTSHIGSNVSPPLFRCDPIGRRHDLEFPIRKTVSEPNLKVKAALRQRLTGGERRSSPLASGRPPQHQQLPPYFQQPWLDKYSTMLTVDTGTQDAVSRADNSSPPHLEDSRRRLLSLTSYGSLASLREEGLLKQVKHLPPEYLHISMPNITLATPPTLGLNDPSSGRAASTLTAASARGTGRSDLTQQPLCEPMLMKRPAAATTSEAEHYAQQHAAAAAMLLSALAPSLSVGGVPSRLLHPAFQPAFPGLREEEYHQSVSAPGSIVHDVRLLAHPYYGGKNSLCLPATVTASDAAQQAVMQRHLQQQQQRHLQQQHKPIVRTHSAPLPIHHPATAASLAPGSGQQPILLEHQRLMKLHQEQYAKEQQKKMVIGQLRQTILQRSGSRSHMEHVSEEAEARLAMEMQESREDIDETQESAQQQWRGRTSGEPYEQPAIVSNFAPHGAGSVCGSGGTVDYPVRDPDGRWVTDEGPHSAAAVVTATHHNSNRAGDRSSHRLSRARSSPLVMGSTLPTLARPHPPPSSQQQQQLQWPASRRTGLAYDDRMLKHRCACGNDGVHLESPDRIRHIWARLSSEGLVTKCERVDAKKATMEQLQLCHAESYSLFFGVTSFNRKKFDLDYAGGVEFTQLPCGGLGVDSDTVWNEEHSAHAARVAAGCVLELASRVACGTLLNGMAVVRPPGHHAEHSQAMGFCYFNSVAIAAKWMKAKYSLERILIVDWDVHHGNGTQQMTYDDPHILYLSLHRHDNGNFFPGTGAPSDCGEGRGLGFNVNIAFSGALNPPMGDAEYMAAFRCLVLPIAADYKPQLVLVSAGFDAADGHAAPLGGYKLTPACFGLMTRQLMAVAEGKVILVLEGGYDLSAICDASEMCLRALLSEEIPLPRPEEMKKKPCNAAVVNISECIRIQARYWPVVVRHIHEVGMSYVSALHLEREATETVSSAMASLSVAAAAVAAARNGVPARLCDELAPDTGAAGYSSAEPMDEV